MSRIVVIGGRGFFGAAAVELLRRDGERPLVGSRRPGSDLRVDAEDPASLGAARRAGDVVIDAAGPFQRRTPLLAETALAAGADVIDLADSLDHALAMRRLAPRIERAGTRVLAGLVAADRQVDPAELVAYLEGAGVRLFRGDADGGGRRSGQDDDPA